MPDDDKSELSKELMQAVKDQNLDHVETKTTKSEVVLKFKCQECGEFADFPMHCDLQMTYEEGSPLKCDTCGETAPVPAHHDKPMKPFITGA